MLAEQCDINGFFLIRFKDGDQLAFEKIFKSNNIQLVNFCNHFISDIDKSKSLAQEAFVNLWLNRQKIETFNGIKAFLYTYARSGCLNYIRHRKVVSRYENLQLQQKEDSINSEVLESFDFNSLEFIELEELIMKLIHDLPDQCRKVFMLSRFEGKKNKEIAEDLNITIKSVEANITRALKSLRTDLSEYLPIILVQIIMQYLASK
jgi:RNA polymerase sigma-70 factor (ECF subfamily)